MYLIVFSTFLLVVVGMSIGVLMGRERIKGSCGGVGNIDGLESNCQCEKPCESKKQRLAQANSEDNTPSTSQTVQTADGKTEHRVNFP